MKDKKSSFFSSDIKDQGKLYKLVCDFSYKRNFFEAGVFYAVQYLGIIAIILVGGKILQFIAPTEWQTNNAVTIAMALILLALAAQSFSLLHAKKILTEAFPLTLVVLGIALTYFFGLFIGLLPLAYLSMSDKKTA